MGKILIVDDFKSIRSVVVNTIEKYGYETIQAENGEEAINIINDIGTSIDLIISDYNMPKVNGYELLLWVKNNTKYKKIPFILLTSESNMDKMKKSKEAGLDAWILKPYKIESFIQNIKYLIDKK